MKQIVGTSRNRRLTRRGQAWGSPGYGQGYAVLGERAWIADVSVVGGGQDKRDAVVLVLGMMLD